MACHICSVRRTNARMSVFWTTSVYIKGAWGGQAADIMSGWKVEGNMELEYPRYPFDFQAIDERYKIADSINLDYRIAASSPLVEGGCGDSFRFDFNGYKKLVRQGVPYRPFPWEI